MRAIPEIPVSVEDEAARRYLADVKTLIETWVGNHDLLDRVVTWRDLQEAGVEIAGAKAPVVGDVRFQIPSSGFQLDSATPPAPTGVAYSAALTAILLRWDAAPYSQHSHTEIRRAPSNNFSLSESIGSAAGNRYIDETGEALTTFYYWFRHVSLAGVPGPWHDINGMAASSATVGGVNLGDHVLAADKLAAGSLDLSGTKFSGQVVSDLQFQEGAIGNAAINGVVADSLTIAEGAIGLAKIGTLTLDSPVLFSEACIQSADIAVATFGQAEILSGEVDQLVVQNADIEDAAIKTANFALVSVDNFNLQNHAIVASVTANTVGQTECSLPFTLRTRNDGGTGHYPVVFSFSLNGTAIDPASIYVGKYQLLLDVLDGSGAVVFSDTMRRDVGFGARTLWFETSGGLPFDSTDSLGGRRKALNIRGISFIASGLAGGATYTARVKAQVWDTATSQWIAPTSQLGTMDIDVHVMEIAR
ncbi:hypothetical protein PTW32_10875 [Dechloromonas agitata]|uniref:hypothetical protein n=1 Tax=Dechloromonas agitata TaxID=73030 RepID=UPI00237DABD6|nr:hypothetical protein [Dechloromonas agitata]MDE1545923.1 hypothetical protein [Dechloromonas agitata]